MKQQEWMIATAIAAVVMLGYIHQFVFPRTEAEALKQSIASIEIRQAEFEKTFNNELRGMSGQMIRMETKLDTLQNVLIAPAAPAQPARKPDSARSAQPSH